MEPSITQIGVGGIFAILVLREVFGFLKQRKDAAVPELSREAFTMLRELHEMHMVKDPDGVPVWYVRRSLEEAILKLTENLTQQTQVLRDMMLEIKSVKEELRDNRAP